MLDRIHERQPEHMHRKVDRAATALAGPGVIPLGTLRVVATRASAASLGRSRKRAKVAELNDRRTGWPSTYAGTLPGYSPLTEAGAT
jgi:hypothetical protein